MRYGIEVNVITGEKTLIELPDLEIVEQAAPPPTIDQRVAAVETDVDDIITVLAVIEGVSV